MNDFTYTIDIDFNVPGQNLKKITKALDKTGVIDLKGSQFGGMMSSFDKIKTATNVGGLNGSTMPVWMKGVAGLIATGVEITNKIFGEVKKYLPELDSLKQHTDKILEYSKLSNQNTREQALTYGFNPAQNYAYSKSMSFLGLNSFEDLYWLNDQERERFKERFEEYMQQYQSLSDKDVLGAYQELEWTKAELQEELEYMGLKFLAENKDSLLWAFDKITGFFEKTLDFAEKISKFFGKDENGQGFIDRTINKVSNWATNIMTQDTYNVGTAEEALAIGAGKYNYLQTSVNMGGS